jgi:hypothetical protein
MSGQLQFLLIMCYDIFVFIEVFHIWHLVAFHCVRQFAGRGSQSSHSVFHKLITLGGGGGERIYYGYLEIYFTKDPILKEGKIGLIKRKIFIFFLSIFVCHYSIQ